MGLRKFTMVVAGWTCKIKSGKMEPHYYNVDVEWDRDRKGMMCSPELNKDANSCIEVATPPEFPKGIPGIWSPEHLFTAAVPLSLSQPLP